MNNEYILPDVDSDNLTILTGTDIIGAHKGAIAEFIGDEDCRSWCPNALQLLALRDRCNAILAKHAAKDVASGPYKLDKFVGLDGAVIEIESGFFLDTPNGAVIRIDIQGNENGPPWVGCLDDLAFLSSAIDEIWDRYNPPPTKNNPLVITLAEDAVLSEFNTSASGQQTLQDALDSLGDGVVVDKAGNLCLTSGEVVAVAEPDRIVWLQRIAAIVNAMVEAREQ